MTESLAVTHPFDQNITEASLAVWAPLISFHNFFFTY